MAHSRSLAVATEYEPSFVHNEQGERSAAVITIDLGKHVTREAVSWAVSILCAGVAWWAITEHRVTQGRLEKLMIQQDALVVRVQELEKSHAIR